MTRPRLWDCTEGLCWIARDILRKRMVGYPAAVTAGKMTPIAAETGLRIAAAIAADWTRAIELSPVADFAPPPLPQPLDLLATATAAERIETLETAFAHPAVQSEPAYAELVEALLWWERAEDQGRTPIALLNRINADLRGNADAARLVDVAA
jgi:hypothetical protein